MIDLTGGDFKDAGQEGFMTSSMGSGSAMPPTEWQSSTPSAYTRTQLMAFLRAGVIALVLLVVLALIVLY
ncbi:hypothetical protein A5650_15495 [Mycobacterium sp. 1164985.4]|nr:hypothetical protein A5650_15495 [Mycobacterium sp. 1164985.4]